MKVEEFNKDFFEGLKAGLKIAKDVALKQGYELTFPDVDKIRIEKMNGDNNVRKRK